MSRHTYEVSTMLRIYNYRMNVCFLGPKYLDLLGAGKTISRRTDYFGAALEL